LNLLPPSPAFLTMEIDPQKLRLAIEGMVRQIDQQNRAI
jgi:hypothetical protein